MLRTLGHEVLNVSADEGGAVEGVSLALTLNIVAA